jgi:hypothetical protein
VELGQKLQSPSTILLGPSFVLRDVSQLELGGCWLLPLGQELGQSALELLDAQEPELQQGQEQVSVLLVYYFSRRSEREFCAKKRIHYGVLQYPTI